MLSKACNVLSVHMDFDRFQYAVCILGCALCSAHSLVSRVYYLVSSVDYLLCSVQNAVGCVECSCAGGGGGLVVEGEYGLRQVITCFTAPNPHI